MTAIERVGRENVYFWVFEENRPILDLMDLIPRENVIVIRAKTPIRLMLDMLGTLWRVRKMKFDATVDMEFFSRASAILAFLSGAKRRAGLHRFKAEMPYRGDLLTHRVQHNPYIHVAIHYHELVEVLWADPHQKPLYKVPTPSLESRAYDAPRFEPTNGEVHEVRDIVQQLAKREVAGPIVLLNPNAGDLLPIRRWEPDRFVEVACQVLEEHEDALLIVTGGPSERSGAERVAAAIGARGFGDRCISIAGHTTLRQLVVLYTIADVLVTNDSGPGHFASLTVIDAVILFGPETPRVFGPLGRHSHVLWENLLCSPCVNVMNHRFSPCDDNVCMQRITVEMVTAKVNELLRQRQGKTRGLQVLTS
jgi:ADP-heptose:LPS heptosyltransferase